MCGYFCIRFIDFMFAGKTLPEFTNLFSPNIFERNDDIIPKYFMTNVWNRLSAAPLNVTPLSAMYIPNLSTAPLNAITLRTVPLKEQQQFKLNKINEIKDYFVTEITERELTSKRISK